MKGRELDKIDKYILGEMDAEELKEFKEGLVTNSDLKTDVLIRKAIHQEINKEYKQELKSKLIQHDKELDNKNWITPLIRIAAVSLIVLVGIYSTYKNYYQTDVSKYDFYEEGINNYMNDDSEMVMFNNAMSHFRSEDYDNAIKEFEQLSSSKPTSDTLNYYLGVSYYREGDFYDAIQKLQTVLNNEHSIYYDKAYFRLGLSYYANSNKKSAKPIFENISRESSHPFSTDAKAILDSW